MTRTMKIKTKTNISFLLRNHLNILDKFIKITISLNSNLNYWILIWISVLLCGIPVANAASAKKDTKLMPDEQRLLMKTFRNYDNSVRPVYNATNSVVVGFGMTLIQIMDMDEKNQVLVSNVWLTHEWQDERIKWDPVDYNNLEVIRIPAKKLWLPDIVLYNNADDFTTGYMPSNAMVSSDGYVFWSPPARLLSSCKVDITYFPFDEQICELKFGSWTYDQAQVDLLNSSEFIDMSNYITNGEWELKGSKVKRNEVIYPIGDAVYPDVTIAVIIHRRILYYILNIILPCVWLNMLSLLSFCLPPDAGEKITLGITVLLSYSVFMLLVAENMPSTSEFVPLIGIYLTISMAVTSISVILTVCVLKLHHCGPHQAEVPGWMRCLVLGFMAAIVRCQCSTSTRKRPSYIDTKLKDSERNADVCLRLMSEINTKRSPLVDIRHNNMNHVGSNHDKHQEAHNENQSPYFPYNNTYETNNATLSQRPPQQANNQNCNNQYTQDLCSIELQRLKVLEEILKYLKLMVAKRDEDDRETDIVNEWRQVAQVMDRFLFWFFMLVSTIATLVIMVIIPLRRYMAEHL